MNYDEIVSDIRKRAEAGYKIIKDIQMKKSKENEKQLYVAETDKIYNE